MKRKIKIMMVEDHPNYRETIAFAMKTETDFELTGQFGTAEQALSSLNDLSTKNTPDLILLDLNLPGISGTEALPEFRAALPDTKIIVLTQSNKEKDLLLAIQRGAAGYLLKSSSVEKIVDAFHSVMRGEASLDSNLAMCILNSLNLPDPSLKLEKELTNRELEILTLLAEGLIKKEIAEKLDISIHTVITHIAHIFQKLEVNTAPAAIHKAHRLNLFKSKPNG